MLAVSQRHELLVVDDDAAVSSMLERGMSRRGFSVVVAETLGEARDALGLRAFESCVLDLQLRGEWGLDLAPALRAHNVRVVVLSGYLSIALTRHAILDLGVADVLAKPVGGDRLASALRGEHVGADPTSDVAHPKLTLDEVQREHIYRTLLEVNGNVSEAARRLGIHRQSLQRKLRKRSVHR